MNPLTLALAPPIAPEHADEEFGPYSLATYTDSEFSEVCIHPLQCAMTLNRMVDACPALL